MNILMTKIVKIKPQLELFCYVFEFQLLRTCRTCQAFGIKMNVQYSICKNFNIYYVVASIQDLHPIHYIQLTVDYN